MDLRLLYHRKTLSALTALMVMVTLYFGLEPKGYRVINNVQWLYGLAGIQIDRYGHAFASLPGAYPAPYPLSLEMAFQSDGNGNDRFKILLSVHAGKDEEQLLIGQWHS